MDRSLCIQTTLSPHALHNGNCRHLTIYTRFCSFLKRFRPKMREIAAANLHKASQWASWSTWSIQWHTPTSLLYVANNRSCKIRSLSENWRQENSSAWQKIRISFLHSQQQRLFSPDSISCMASAGCAAFPSDKGFWSQLYCPPCYERAKRVNTYCAHFFN